MILMQHVVNYLRKLMIKYIKNIINDKPMIGVVLGSGLNSLIDSLENIKESHMMKFHHSFKQRLKVTQENLYLEQLRVLKSQLFLLMEDFIITKD